MSIPKVLPTNNGISTAIVRETHERKLPPPLPTSITSVASSTFSAPALSRTPRPTKSAIPTNETKASHLDWAQKIANIAAKTANQAAAAATDARVMRPTEGWITVEHTPACIEKCKSDVIIWRAHSELYRIGNRCIHLIGELDDLPQLKNSSITSLEKLANLGYCTFLTTNLYFGSMEGRGLDNATLDALMSATISLIETVNHLDKNSFSFNLDYFHSFLNTFDNEFGQQIWITVIASLKKDPIHRALAEHLETMLPNSNCPFFDSISSPLLNLEAICFAANRFLKTCLEAPSFDFQVDMPAESNVFRKMLTDLLSMVSLEKTKRPISLINIVSKKLHVAAIEILCKIYAINLLKQLPHYARDSKPIFCLMPLDKTKRFKQALKFLTTKS